VVGGNPTTGQLFERVTLPRPNQMDNDLDLETLLTTPEGVKEAYRQLETRLIDEAQKAQRAAGKKTVTPRMTLSHALGILAPTGHQEACLAMAIGLGWQPKGDKTVAENLFNALHGVALILRAYDIDPRYIKPTEANCGHVAECDTVIDPTTLRHKATHTKMLTWFRKEHATEAEAIGERIKTNMRRKGWKI
jgi:hypothetical protein